MRFFLHTIALVLLVAACRTALFAQEVDSVWHVKWERYIENPDGSIEPAPYMNSELWLSEDHGRLTINDDRYITLSRDSVYILDVLNKRYTHGLIKDRDLINLRKDIYRHRRVAPPLSMQQTLVKKTIRDYETTEWIIDVAANHKFMPMRTQMFLTDQLPLPDSLLRTFYNAVAFVESDLSIDFFTVTDSLRNMGVIALMTKLRANIPTNTAGWLVTELTTLERVAVPKEFFFPPKEYAYYPLELPTEEDLWIANTIMMPGGPKRR